MDGTLVITVGLVDDHELIADGLRARLERDGGITVAWVAHSKAEAERALTRGSRVDVVLVDIALPDGSGLDLLPTQAGPGPRFVVLCANDGPAYVSTAYRRGASGFVTKGERTETVITAIRTVAAGGRAFTAESLESIHTLRSLTRRELQVVRLVASGRSNDEIGAELGIGIKTVEFHLHNIYEQFGLGTRAELAVWAERQGWLDAP